MSDFKVKTINTFFKRAVSVLERLDAWLPQPLQEPNWAAVAFRWQQVGQQGILQALPIPHTFPLSRLAAVDKQMQQLVRNTEQFLAGRPANNALLSGARGTGKSSLVKALLHEYAEQGLRLIEVDKQDLASLPSLLKLLQGRAEKFIVFCDDLSFEHGDDGYKALKTALDGGLSVRADNVIVYATSNRRHLLPEYFADNTGYTGDKGEVHPQEAVEEKVSLSDRFGLWLSFYPFDQIAYLQAVENWLQAADVVYDDIARKAALNWSLSRGGRSGRVAWQFVCDWVGRLPEERIID
jgi:predicted AAA+ superfamily ATPase